MCRRSLELTAYIRTKVIYVRHSYFTNSYFFYCSLIYLKKKCNLLVYRVYTPFNRYSIKRPSFKVLWYVNLIVTCSRPYLGPYFERRGMRTVSVWENRFFIHVNDISSNVRKLFVYRSKYGPWVEDLEVQKNPSRN